MALGKNVEHLRTLRSMSRGAVARAIGLDDDQPIYALEKRDSKRSNLAPALAKLFEVSLEALLEEDLSQATLSNLPTQKRARPNSAIGSEGMQQLAEAYQALDESGRNELLRFADYLLHKERPGS